MRPSLVLGIETSCDDTACAVVDSEGRVLASVVSSQLAVHRPYGGVVPELASREQLATWQQRTVSLSAYAGQSVRLAWRYGTDSSQAGEGWYVDDIALTHAQIPGRPSSSSATPCWSSA